MSIFNIQVSAKQFFRDLTKEITEDNVLTGAAALAYYLTLSIFPALIFMLTLVPFLPIEKVDVAMMDLVRQALPNDAATMLSGVVQDISANRKEGLLSLGLLGLIWTASSGVRAAMEQLNITYDVDEGRSVVKTYLISFGLMLMLGALILSAFLLIVLGGQIQGWLDARLGWGTPLLVFFAVLRWAIVVSAILFAFALTYYFGPDVEQRFRFVTPGSVIGTAVLVITSLLFRAYVTNFGNYNATYGSIGAVVVLMLWLYVFGIVLLLGSEINALIEHYHPEGKNKGEKQEPLTAGKLIAQPAA